MSDPPPAADPTVRRDDRLAIVAVLCGIGVALQGRRDGLELVTGLGVALGGVLLAMRGGKPIQARTWMTAALALAVIGILCAGALEVYEEWVAGQWFAEGNHHTQGTGAELRKLARTLGLLRIGALAGGLSFLLGAIVTRFTSADPPPSGQPGPSGSSGPIDK
jgi:hypothetical protein